MTASRLLGAARGISPYVLREIDRCHVLMEHLIEAALVEDIPTEEVLATIENLEFTLQRLWKFPEDPSFHRYGKQYLFRKSWYGRKFRCAETGVEFTMPIDVRERECYAVGSGFVDVGRYEAYHRIVGPVSEVTDVL